MANPQDNVIFQDLTNEFTSIGYGISRSRIDGNYDTGLRRFRSLFGIPPEGCSVLWKSITPRHLDDTLKKRHLLYALLFLKVYGTEHHENHAITGVDEKTFRKHTWRWVNWIATELDVVSRH